MAEFGSPDLQTLTLEAAADLSAHQYTAMRVAGANKCNVASQAVDSTFIGILQNKPKSGEFATIAVFGKSKMLAGGTITAGAPMTINSSGRAIAVTSGNLEIVFGQALDAAATGDTFTVLLKPTVRWVGQA